MHNEINLQRGTWNPIQYTELLYADDTVLITNNVNAMNRFLAKVQEHASYFGLKFNEGKCAAMTINADGILRFRNGEKVPKVNSTVYLGANINDKDDPKQDVNTRLGACFSLLNKLDYFWRKSNCTVKFKLDVFDAVVRSKLVYSLETVQLPPSLLKKLNSIQFKGLRKILNIEHTYVNRANTNESILQRANQYKNPRHLPGKNILPFSAYVHKKQEQLLKHVVRSPNEDPLRQAMLQESTPYPVVTEKRRVGRPKQLWTHEVYKRIWNASGLGSQNAFEVDSRACIARMADNIYNRSL